MKKRNHVGKNQGGITFWEELRLHVSVVAGQMYVESDSEQSLTLLIKKLEILNEVPSKG